MEAEEKVESDSEQGSFYAWKQIGKRIQNGFASTNCYRLGTC